MNLQYYLRCITLAAVVAAMAAPSSLSAETSKEFLKVTDIKVARTDGELSVALDINPRAINPGRDKEVVFTPVVVSETGSERITLPSITVAGRNRYYSHLRNDDIAEGEKIWQAGTHETIRYRQEVAFEPWMGSCQIVMEEAVGNCCDSPVLVGNTPLAQLDFTEVEFIPTFTYLALTGDETIERTAEGRAFVDFRVNKTDIVPTYRNNKAELAKILSFIKAIKDDPDAIITSITIKGFASPEGKYENNARLATGRTQALKEYVRNEYNFDSAIMHSDSEPEDWEGLRSFLETCTLPHRAEILAIVDSDMLPDPKDNAIKASFPQEYKILLDSVYPSLRHSDYAVKYNFREIVDINELKKAYAGHPDRLRPVDFQRIAGTYQDGTPDREEVYLTAAKIHPADVKANINAANIALRRGDSIAAADYLSRAGDSAEAVYTRGLLAAMAGDLQGAGLLFKKAADLGLEKGDSALRHINEIVNRPNIIYLIEPTL